jgi:2-dehydro-3-deoxyphosphogluconate aldolase/(4S)-4-hydroxy-2-oxoglutarate aldolase
MNMKSSRAAQSHEQLIGLLRSARVIPVLTIERAEDAVPLARALVEGGVRVLNPEDLARAEALGARFAISPGATPQLLDAAAAGELPFMPGIATASELMQALARGFDLVKFFPAEQSGGLKALRALGGPFPQVRFCPTGGISESNAATWLAEPNVVVVGGSWLCPAADIRSGNWAGITTICDRTMKMLSR